MHKPSVVRAGLHYTRDGTEQERYRQCPRKLPHWMDGYIIDVSRAFTSLLL